MLWRGFRLSLFSFEDAQKGDSVFCFQKEGKRKGFICQRRTKLGYSLKNTLKMTNEENRKRNTDSTEHAQKKTHFFVEKDRRFSKTCKMTVFLQRIFDFSTGFIEAHLFHCLGFTSSFLCDSMRKNNQTKGLHDDDTE